ncbi:copper chaperone NosL [Paenibacillus anaericanus]|uniref:nitrous oxide reductase accessory protein NosL n=1 Tax=Paenibacillus anaericanus TaxID=170367 RepID=UPI00277F2725|nr:nitrous oxide reductase accessory protein NosL [Paenibacillus anaericanus]MDQ0087073.1 copper chaperone NosL [Paenibacillus anaericanus]
MKKWSMVFALMLGIFLLVGCGQKKYTPQAINEDVDVCVICNMQVKDDAFATQIVTKDGKSLKFDDIGCMNEWKQKNGEDHIGMDYVRDYNDKEWIQFNTATYVYDSSFRTPMAYGVISFKDKKSAEDFVHDQGAGQILSANELSNHSWQQSKDKMDMHMHMEEGMDGDMHEDMNMDHNGH